MPLITPHHAAVIERAVAAADGPSPLGFGLTIGARRSIDVEPVHGLELPTSWIASPVDARRRAVGLCLPLTGAGAPHHVGAVVDRAGASVRFTVDRHRGRARLQMRETDSALVVDDFCRRRLGLPTPSPGFSTEWYWMREWLSAVGRLGVKRPWMLDAATVAGCHPAVDAIDLDGFDLHELIEIVVSGQRDHACIADWECIRLDALAGTDVELATNASLLDDGSFARWISATGWSMAEMGSLLLRWCDSDAKELVGAVVSDVVLRSSFS